MEQAQQPYDQLWANFHLLQVWDLLGLYFGCQEPVEDHIDPRAHGLQRPEGEHA